MNKLFTKIAAACVGIAMAVGVGVAIGVDKTVTPVHAADATISSFSAASNTSSGVNGILYSSYQGGGTSVPQVSSNKLRLYQKTNGDDQLGGYVVFYMKDNSKITGFSATFGATNEKARYGVSDTNKASNFNASDFVETNYSVSTSSGMSISGLNTNYLLIGNFRYTGSNGTQRLDIASITISYQASASYTITYKANGGSGTVPSATTGSGTVTLRSAAESTSLTRNGYVLDGWNTEAHKDAVAADYALGGSYNLTADVDLYAHWNPVYTVTYETNSNGTGSDHSVANVPSGSYELLTLAETGLTAKSGFAFREWLIDDTPYAEGAAVTIGAATTVTANFVAEVTLSYDGNGYERKRTKQSSDSNWFFYSCSK